MKKNSLHAVPLELREANDFVNKLHRHHEAVHRDKFRVGAADDSGTLRGVIQAARPTSRRLDDGSTLEVVRLCTDGYENACSFLYSKIARVAKELGYKKIITYILENESGASLKASGWFLENECCGGGSWNVPSRPRKTSAPIFKKKRYAKILY